MSFGNNVKLKALAVRSIGKQEHAKLPTSQRQSDHGVDEALIREILEFNTSPECNDAWLNASINDCVSGLFKVSRLITKSSTRDRHAKSYVAKGAKFDNHYDVEHVKQKFEASRAPLWLLERLGKANTMRRQFFRYCRTHREQLAHTTITPKGHSEAHKEVIGIDISLSHLEMATIVTNITASRLSAVQTEASSLGPINLAAAEDAFDDTLSSSTFATSVERGDHTSHLAVPPLDEFSAPGMPFECPYCLTIQRFNGQAGWKYV